MAWNDSKKDEAGKILVMNALNPLSFIKGISENP